MPPPVWWNTIWVGPAQIGGQFNYSQRGPNVDVWISEHAYRPDRWAKR